MSDYFSGLDAYMKTNKMDSNTNVKVQKKSSDLSLNMTDFLTLMLAEFQHQSIDDTADTSEMLNQLVQMQMITALTNLTDSSVMTYAASLVGKEVTIGVYDEKGTLHEIVGTVSGTGTYGGTQVIFVNDTLYTMDQILAVGRLPEIQQPEEPKPDNPDGGDVENPDVENPDVENPGGDDLNTDNSDTSGGTSQTDPE